LVDAMEANYPGLSGNVPPARTAIGEERTQGATGLGRLVPFRYDIERPDPLLEQLRTAGVRVPDTPKAVNYGGGHIDLTEEERATLQQARGRAIREYVSAYALDPKFQALPLAERNRYLQRLVSQATQMASRQFAFELPADQLTARWKAKQVPEPYYLGEAS
jgi:hypothetical protein